tara:strand:+ start:792 stop:1292 length:501 start_codon:yes stop_codon:yes gene_type:complete
MIQKLKENKDMIQVENNYLDNVEFSEIQKVVSSKDFLWSIKKINPFILSHYLVDKQGENRSCFIDKVLSSVLKKLKAEIVLESSITVYDKYNEAQEHLVKSEFLKNKNYKSCLLYLNSNDGFTKILGLEKIPCVENRAILTDISTSFIEINPIKNNFKTVLAVHYL